MSIALLRWWLIFIAALLPFAWIVYLALGNHLGPDPAQELSIQTGEWTLRFLLATLALTPLRQLTGIQEFVRRRRMIGLFTLFYASVHFLSWMSFLLAFRWSAIGEEIVQRPFITVGFVSFIILVALGITSPKAMVRRMGVNWKRLHRLVYVAAVLAIVHQLWIQRTDLIEPVTYGSILALLLGYRVVRRKRRAEAAG